MAYAKNQENVNAFTTRSHKVSESGEEKTTYDNLVIEVDLKVRENKQKPEEALENISLYKKFMKETISKKRPLGDELGIVTKKCGRVSPERKISIKKEDPRAVIISSTINDITFE